MSGAKKRTTPFSPRIKLFAIVAEASEIDGEHRQCAALATTAANQHHSSSTRSGGDLVRPVNLVKVFQLVFGQGSPIAAKRITRHACHVGPASAEPSRSGLQGFAECNLGGHAGLNSLGFKSSR